MGVKKWKHCFSCDIIPVHVQWLLTWDFSQKNYLTRFISAQHDNVKIKVHFEMPPRKPLIPGRLFNGKKTRMYVVCRDERKHYAAHAFMLRSRFFPQKLSTIKMTKPPLHGILPSSLMCDKNELKKLHDSP